MTDYTGIGLDQNLNSLNSPAGSQQTNNTAFGFDINQNEIPLGAINFSHIMSKSRDIKAVLSTTKTQGGYQDIQAALTYVNRIGGGKVLVTQGTYPISKNILLYNNTLVMGESINNCVFDFGGGTNQFYSPSNGTLTDFAISNLGFQNGAIANDSVLSISNGANIYISNCKFGTNNGASGGDISTYYSSNVYVSNCISKSPTTFYFSYGAANNNMLINNTVTNNEIG